MLKGLSGMLALLLCLQLTAAHASDMQTLLREARELLPSKPSAAVDLLEDAQLNYAGQPDYDYLLGLAYLASGSYSRATLAFERVLIVRPAHVGARIDSGLAYLKMGNREQALAAFERVLAAHPPEKLRALAEEGRQLAMRKVNQPGIDLRENLRGFFELSLGTDSNLNSATSDATTTAYFNGVPVLLFLNPTSTANSDRVFRFAAGSVYQRPLSDSSQLEVALNAAATAPWKRNEYQSLSTGGSLAYQWFTESSRWSLGGNAGYAWLDDSDYLGYAGFNSGWRKTLNDASLLDLSAAWTQFRYADAARSVNDYDQSLLVGRVLHRLPGRPIIASFALLGVYEDAISGRADGDKNFFGASFGLEGDTRFADSGHINFAWSKSLYHRNNQVFATQREDSQLDVRTGLNWQLDADWTLSAELSLTAVKSNINIYSYNRNTAMLMLRKDFGGSR